MTADDRRYSDDEFAEVLRRAQAMEAGRETARDDRLRVARPEGLTLGEMRDIAREAGIDPDLVSRAAVALTWSPTHPDPWYGGPVHLRTAFDAPGNFSEAARPRVVGAIRAAAAHHGVVMPEPGALVWRTTGQPTQLDVTLEAGSDRTRVTVTADRSQAAGLTLFGSLAGWLVAAGVTGAILDPVGAPGAVAILGTAVVGGAVTARTLWRWGTRRLRRRIDEVAAAVAEALEADTEG